MGSNAANIFVCDMPGCGSTETIIANWPKPTGWTLVNKQCFCPQHVVKADSLVVSDLPRHAVIGSPVIGPEPNLQAGPEPRDPRKVDPTGKIGAMCREALTTLAGKPDTPSGARLRDLFERIQLLCNS